MQKPVDSGSDTSLHFPTHRLQSEQERREVLSNDSPKLPIFGSGKPRNVVCGFAKCPIGFSQARMCQHLDSRFRSRVLEIRDRQESASSSAINGHFALACEPS